MRKKGGEQVNPTAIVADAGPVGGADFVFYYRSLSPYRERGQLEYFRVGLDMGVATCPE
jgi:hypothetical protein